ncbi:MAG: cytochrome C oxidase subunit IV family protein [Spirochaetota bacterium]
MSKQTRQAIEELNACDDPDLDVHGGTHGICHPHGSIRFFVGIWAVLICFTLLTVAMASWNLGGFAIVAVLAIAATKSTLVFLGFMHLWWEDKLVIKILLPVVLVLLAIFIGLTYTDILYR